MSSTIITKAGLAAAARAGLHGPEIRVTQVKLGSNLIADLNSSLTDVSGLVWSGGTESIKYQILNESTIIFKVTLDETIGNFNIGNIGLFLDTGELFCITSLPALSYKQKSELPDVVGNRRIFNIPIVLSGIATITDLTILVADESNVPTVNTELQLPDPLVAPYSVYEVLNHTQFGVPVLALRVDSQWWYIPSQLANGSGYQFGAEDFDQVNPPLVGDAVRFNPDTKLFEKADSTDLKNGYMGFRSENNTVITTGIYRNPNSTTEIPAYVTGLKYYADGGANAGRLTTSPTGWYVGIAIDGDRLLLDAQNITLATESYPGNVQFATEEEVTNGNVKDKVVSPFTLSKSASVRPNEFSNGQFYNLSSTSPVAVQDWSTQRIGTSTFTIDLISHNRDSWIEGPNNFIRLRHTNPDESQTDPSKFLQKVYNSSLYQNQTKTISFRARGSQIGMNIAIGARVVFGTGGAASNPLVLATKSVILSTEWTVYETTIEIPQLTGIYTFGTNNDDYIEYYVGVYSANTNYMDLDWIKLETGTAATPITSNTPEFCLQNDANYIYHTWTFTKNAVFKDGVTLSGNSTFGGNISFSSATTFSNTVTFNGATNFNQIATFGNQAVFNKTTKFKGVATFDQVIEGTARKAYWA